MDSIYCDIRLVIDQASQDFLFDGLHVQGLSGRKPQFCFNILETSERSLGF